MKKLLFLFLLALHLSAATAQQVNPCGFIIPPPAAPRSNFVSVNEAATVIHTILSTINWKENFYIAERPGSNNAYATMIGGKRVIVYDNDFLDRLDEYTGTKWASVSVLAHEMGHHYFNHIIRGTGSTPEDELQADYFSGYVLEKMGATAAEAEVAMQAVSPLTASRTHPGRAERVAAIQRGWNYAVGGVPPTNASSRNPTPPPQETPPPPVAAAQWINLSLYANQGMTVYLSDNGRTYAPAQLSPTQPFVFQYEIYNYGWMRFTSNGPVYRLVHGRDYSIVWNRRTNNWTVVEVK